MWLQRREGSVNSGLLWCKTHKSEEDDKFRWEKVFVQLFDADQKLRLSGEDGIGLHRKGSEEEEDDDASDVDELETKENKDGFEKDRPFLEIRLARARVHELESRKDQNNLRGNSFVLETDMNNFDNLAYATSVDPARGTAGVTFSSESEEDMKFWISIIKRCTIEPCCNWDPIRLSEKIRAWLENEENHKKYANQSDDVNNRINSKRNPITDWKQRDANTNSPTSGLSSNLVDSVDLICDDDFDLPMLNGCQVKDIPKVFRCKLRFCSAIWQFSSSFSNDRDNEARDMKRRTLSELVCFADSPQLRYALVDEIAIYDMVQMIALHVFHPVCNIQGIGESNGGLVGVGPSNNVEGNDQSINSSWPHTSLAYELLLRIVESNLIPTEVKRRCFTEDFCSNFIQLFRSTDSRERDYVKTIAHCLYSKIVSHRGVMRKGMSSTFLEFTYVTQKHEGIAEILEVYGAIASGFAPPIKEEHKRMLFKCLLPLHSAKGSEFFQEQLAFVLIQFITKDNDLVVPIVLGILKYWPTRNATKQILFLSELEEMLGMMKFSQFPLVQHRLVSRLCHCIEDKHFQVAEYAMGLLNTQFLYNVVFEDTVTRKEVLPLVLYSLRKASNSWNGTVKQVAKDVIAFVQSLDEALFHECEQISIDREKKIQNKLQLAHLECENTAIPS